MAAFKPAVTGLDEPPGEWPPDHELLAAVANAGQASDEVAPYRFGPPVSPHLAAEVAATSVERDRLLEAAHAAAARAGEGGALICEGVGGLMVPLRADYLIRDLAAELAFPVVIAARPTLGTINHTLLTVEAARAGGLAVAGVVMTPWPDEPDLVQESSRQTIEELAGVPVSVLPTVRRDTLAAAGSGLPLNEWVAM